MSTEKSKTTETAMTADPLLAADKFNIVVKKVIDINNPNITGFTYKFDNRRVTVAKHETGFIFEFRSMDKDPTPHATCEHIHGKMALTRINLSKEASEIIMMSLVKQMGFNIYR